MSMTERERVCYEESGQLLYGKSSLLVGSATPARDAVVTKSYDDGAARRGGTPVTLSVSGDEITRPVAAADALFALLSLHLFVLWIPRWQIRWCARTHEVAVAHHRRFSTQLSGALPHASMRC